MRTTLRLAVSVVVVLAGVYFVALGDFVAGAENEVLPGLDWVRDHPRTSILIVASISLAGVLVDQLIGRRSPEQAPLEQVVFGRIPRRPVAFQMRPELRRQLPRIDNTPLVVIFSLIGLRGVGKTQLAAALAREEVASGVPLVAWLDSESPAVMASQLVELAARLRLVPATADAERAQEALRSYLTTSPRRSLLVFDNAVDVAGVRAWLPASGRSTALVTTNVRAFEGLGPAVEVGCFLPTESTRYLDERIGPDRCGNLGAALADELGHLPLALAQAAAFVVRDHLSVGEYLDRLRSFDLSAHLPADLASDYPRGFISALFLSAQRAGNERAEDRDALHRLLTYLSLLSSEGISRRVLRSSLFVATVAAPSCEPDAAQAGEDLVDRLLGTMAAFSLLTFSADDSAVTLHRLTRRAVQDSMSAARLERAIGSVARALREFGQGPALPADALELGDHIEGLWVCWSERVTAPNDAANRDEVLLAQEWAVQAVYDHGDYRRAISLARHLVDHRVGTSGSTARPALRARATLMSVLRSAGSCAESVAVGEAVSADADAVLGVEDDDALETRNELARCLRFAGQVDRSLVLFDDVLHRTEVACGSESLPAIRRRNNTAYAHRTAGDYSRALSLYVRNLELSTRLLGERDKETLVAVHGIANVLLDRGDPAQAIAHFERVVDVRSAVIGPEHPRTLTSLDGLARSLLAVGRVDEGRPLLRRVAELRGRILGEAHPDAQASRDALAALDDG